MFVSSPKFDPAKFRNLLCVATYNYMHKLPFNLLSMLVYEQYFLTCVLMSHVYLEILLRMIWLRCIRGKKKWWSFCWHLLVVEFARHLIYGHLIRSYRRGCWTFAICRHHLMVYICLKMSINCYLCETLRIGFFVWH